MLANSGLIQRATSGLLVPERYGESGYDPAPLLRGEQRPRWRSYDELMDFGVPLSPAAKGARFLVATLANDSILVTPGAGATLATHLANSKEHQVVMLADPSGHLYESRPEWIAWYPAQTNAVNRTVGELFNADAVIPVRIRGLWLVPNVASVTGVQVQFDINRTSTVGTGGTAITPRPMDTTQPALDADITGRWSATGGMTLSYLYWTIWNFNDETNPGNTLVAYQNQLPVLGSRVVEIALRQNEGAQLKQITSTTVAGTGLLLYFVTDD